MISLNKILGHYYITKKIIKESFIELFSFFYVRVYFVMLFVLNIFLWAMARYIITEVDQPQIALHYSVDFGIDLYDSTSKLYTIPFLGFLFIIFNILLVLIIQHYNKKEIKFIANILFSTSIIANVMLWGATISIYLINFR